MELSQLQRHKNSYVETVKHSSPYKKEPKKLNTKANSFNWKKSSRRIGKWHIIYRFRRDLARFIRTFSMGTHALTSKMNDVKVPRSQKWEKEKNKMVLSHHFTRYQREFRKHMSSFIIGAFSFVAALSWNEAIKETLRIIEFNSNFIFYKYITAAVVSVVCVVVIIFLTESKKL